MPPQRHDHALIVTHQTRMMAMFLNPRLMLILLAAVPFAGGAGLPPQAVQAFVMGAWAGWLLVAPALFGLLWTLGLRDAGQTLRPLMRWPVILLIVGLILWSLDAGPAFSGPAAMGAAGWMWLRRGFRLI